MDWRNKISNSCKNIPDEIKRKRLDAVRKATSGKPLSAEHRKRIGEAQVGKKRPGYIDRLSGETRLKLSLANKGKRRSEETRRKISEAITGSTFSDEHKRNISMAKKGSVSPRKGATLSDETKKKLRAACIGKNIPYETRVKMCEIGVGGIWYGNIRYDSDPQYCEKWTHGFRERVRAAFGYTCQFPGCGRVWKEGEKRLAVHHVNYRKDARCNQDVRPLFIPVCPGSCHAKTNNDRGLWQQYFTELIMTKYGGKCYLTPEEMEAVSQKKYSSEESRVVPAAK